LRYALLISLFVAVLFLCVQSEVFHEVEPKGVEPNFSFGGGGGGYSEGNLKLKLEIA
jgi:hypothetical protein